jgi:hypothetical protein
MSILKETKDLLCEIFDLDPSDVDYIEVHFCKDWGGPHGRDAGGVFNEKWFRCDKRRTIRSATHMETE